MAVLTALPLPMADLDVLRRRVRALAEDRPAVYRMTDPAGRVIYVGKAKRLRPRLMSYFRARYPEDKSARILYATRDISWEYVPSEFAAHLGELRQIQRYRPALNVQLNRRRRVAFIALSGGPAPRLGVTGDTARDDLRRYGPIGSPTRAREAIRVLNDLLGLRDCRERMPIVYAGQGDLFAPERHAACHRHEFRTCLGPCAGFVEEFAYRQRAATAAAFLEGRTIQPLDVVVAEMARLAEAGDFERAARWREKFEQLEWFVAALARARSAVDLLSFVYRDPGTFGDDRAYLIRRGVVRAGFPWPETPIEREAFRAVVRDELEKPDPVPGPMPSATVDETLLLLSWFRRHPEAMRRTESLETWAEAGPRAGPEAASAGPA